MTDKLRELAERCKRAGGVTVLIREPGAYAEAFRQSLAMCACILRATQSRSTQDGEG